MPNWTQRSFLITGDVCLWLEIDQLNAIVNRQNPRQEPESRHKPNASVRVKVHIKLWLNNETGKHRLLKVGKACNEQDMQRAGLDPGKTYTLEVYMSTYEQDTDDKDVVELAPGSQVEASIRLVWPDPEFHIEYDEALQLIDLMQPPQFTYTLEMPKDCPKGELQISVVLNGAAETCPWEYAVCGNYTPPDPQHMKSMAIDPDYVPPDNVAILHVKSTGPKAEEWQIDAYNRRQGKLSKLKIPHPTFLNTDWLSRRNNSQLPHYYQKMLEWARGLDKKLETWLAGVRKQANPLTLIIVDLSQHDFLWEWIPVVEHSEKPGELAPIGALAIMVRWIPPLYPSSGATPHYLQVKEETCHGRGHVFFDQTLASINDERQSADRLQNEESGELRCFAEKLKRSATDFGLFYAGCHGDYTHAPDEMIEPKLYSSLPGDSKNRDPASVVEYSDFEGYFHEQKRRPLVFLNACHSARLVWQYGHKYGFAEVMLAHTARAFIGTLGFVDSHNASDFAGDFFAALYAADDGLAVADFLREQRYQATKDFRDREPLCIKDSKEKEEITARFLDAFIYVYYGNPLLRLKVDKND